MPDIYASKPDRPRRVVHPEPRDDFTLDTKITGGCDILSPILPGPITIPLSLVATLHHDLRLDLARMVIDAYRAGLATGYKRGATHAQEQMRGALGLE